MSSHFLKFYQDYIDSFKSNNPELIIRCLRDNFSYATDDELIDIQNYILDIIYMHNTLITSYSFSQDIIDENISGYLGDLYKNYEVMCPD